MSAEANIDLTAQTPRARRRKLTGRIMEGLATAAALLAVAVLAIVLISVARKGLPAINLDFFTKNAAPFGQEGGGIANAIVGTVIIVLIAAAISLPLGVLLAIFNTEFAPDQTGRRDPAHAECAGWRADHRDRRVHLQPGRRRSRPERLRRSASVFRS